MSAYTFQTNARSPFADPIPHDTTYVLGTFRQAAVLENSAYSFSRVVILAHQVVKFFFLPVIGAPTGALLTDAWPLSAEDSTTF